MSFSLVVNSINFAIPLWFECRASESEKKKIWKKFKKGKLSRKGIISALEGSKELSLGNLSESVKQLEEDQLKGNVLE